MNPGTRRRLDIRVGWHGGKEIGSGLVSHWLVLKAGGLTTARFQPEKRQRMGWLLAQKTLCLFEVDLKGAAAPACVARLGVEYRRLDAVAWAVQRHTSHIPDRHLFPARFARGEQFWTAQHEDKILSYCWATQEPVEIGEIRRVMSPCGDEVYLYDAFTFAEYRGQNLYPALLQRILDSSRQHGLRRALIFVLSDNMASIRGVQKAGFREFQRVTYRNILGFARYTYRPLLNASAGVDLLPA